MDPNHPVFTLRTGMHIAVTSPDGYIYEGVVNETGFSPNVAFDGEFVEVQVNNEALRFALNSPGWTFLTLPGDSRD